jgi:hypothetical protein
MSQSVKKEPQSQLTKYRPVSPLPPRESLDDIWEGCYPGMFIPISDDNFLLMINYLDYFDIKALEQACKLFFVIIRLKGPKFSCPFVFLSHTEIKDSRKQGSHEFCMVLHDIMATYNGDTDMGSVYYFDVIMNQCSSRFHEEDSPVWNVMRLESETSAREINEFWAAYLKDCSRLVCLKLDNASNIDLSFNDHPNLEIFIMELKSADGRGATIDLPPSMKTIILYATEENYRKHYTQNSRPYVDHLYLNAPECMDLELW